MSKQRARNVLLASCAVAASATAQTTYVVDLPETDFVFEQENSSLELKEILHDSFPQTTGCDRLFFEPGSGTWSILLREKGGAPDCDEGCVLIVDGMGMETWNYVADPCVLPGADCQGSAYCQTLSISPSAGSVAGVWSGDGGGAFSSPPAIRFLPTNGIEAEWAGSGTFTTTSGSVVDFDLAVEIRWAVAGGDVMDVSILNLELTPGAGMTSLPFYVSRVDLPILRLASIDGGAANCEGTDVVTIPFGTGVTYDDPLTNVDFPALGGPQFVTNPVHAYYGEQSGRCFYLSDTNDRWWLEPRVERSSESTYLEFLYRHTPDDIYDDLVFVPPYAVRVGAIVGDWLDAAQKRRKYLSDNAAWYNGPVGSPTNPMPESVKKSVAQFQLMPDQGGDTTSDLREVVDEVRSVFGDGVYCRYYLWHYPDTFAVATDCLFQAADDGFFNDGLYPADPSFAAAVREASSDAATVAFYWPAPMAVDYRITITNANNPSPFHLAVLPLFSYDERLRYSLASSSFFPRRMTSSLQGFFHDHWLDQLDRGVTFAEPNGVYLDFYQTVLNFASPQFGLPTPTHPPGGGDYQLETELTLIRELQCEHLGAACSNPLDVPEGLPPGTQQLAVSSEFLSWRKSELVHIALNAPLENFLSFSSGEIVPLFRATHDNVKTSAITKTNLFAAGGNMRAWMAATDIFLFGQIYGERSVLADLLSPFHSRRYAPTWRFFSKTARLLRDEDFFRWHNGSIERLPDISVGAHAFVPGTDFGPDGKKMFTPAFFDAPLAPGMFRAHPGSGVEGTLAFVMANPMVLPDPALGQGAFVPFTATFDPARYEGFAGVGYEVREYGKSGFDEWAELSLSVVAAGNTFGIAENLDAGDIKYWTFTPVP